MLVTHFSTPTGCDQQWTLDTGNIIYLELLFGTASEIDNTVHVLIVLLINTSGSYWERIIEVYHQPKACVYAWKEMLFIPLSTELWNSSYSATDHACCVLIFSLFFLLFAWCTNWCLHRYSLSQKEIKINGKPMTSLSSVCYWGYKTRKGFDKITKDYYDQTVFITR